LKSIKYIIFLLGTVLSLNAQDFSDEWTGYFSYNNITDVARGFPVKLSLQFISAPILTPYLSVMKMG